METTNGLMPRARQDELVVEELPDETLVYDLKRHEAHCLNRTSALAWRRCDGRTTVAEVAVLLGEGIENSGRRGSGVDGAGPPEWGAPAEGGGDLAGG